jgi:nucleoside triphosphatase
MSTQFPKPTVAALIKRPDGKMLFLESHKWGGRLCIPAGKIEFGETIEQAVKREVREETGLEVHSLRCLMLQEIINPEEFFKEDHFVSFSYLCGTDSEKVTLNEEAERYHWLSPDEALKQNLNAPTKTLLESLLSQEGIISINNLTFDCIVGIYAEERVTPQPLTLEIKLHTNTSRSAISRNVSDTVDYAELKETIVHFVKEQKFGLLEEMVEAVANITLENPLIQKVTIEAKKPHAFSRIGFPSVEITRERRAF